jgi:hypothetical protein
MDQYATDGETADGSQERDPGTDAGDENPGNNESDQNGTLTPKGSDGGSGTKDLLTGIGVITIVLGILGIVSYMSLRRNGL